jgi:hypothetical protein
MPERYLERSGLDQTCRPDAIISGEGNEGYIRAHSEASKEALLLSMVYNGLSFGTPLINDEVMFERLVAVAAQKGSMLVGPVIHGRPVNSYCSETKILPTTTNPGIDIKMEGFADPAEIPSQDDSLAKPMATPVGSILPWPNLEIIISQIANEDKGRQKVKYTLRLGRGGTTEFLVSVDAEGPQNIDPEHVATVLDVAIPALEVADDAELKTYPLTMTAENAQKGFRYDKRIAGLWQDNIQEHGYGALLYVPSDYLADHSKPGEFVAMDCTTALIPDNVYDYLGDTSRHRTVHRVQTIARSLGRLARTRVPDALLVLGGLPGMFSRIDIMAKSADDEPGMPVVVNVPNVYYDRAAEWLLKNHKDTERAVELYQAMHRAVAGKESEAELYPIALDVDTIVEHALTSQLPWLDTEDRRQQHRKFFERCLGFRRGIEAKELSHPDQQRLIDNAFEALAGVGVKLYAHIYADNGGRPS